MNTLVLLALALPLEAAPRVSVQPRISAPSAALARPARLAVPPASLRPAAAAPQARPSAFKTLSVHAAPMPDVQRPSFEEGSARESLKWDQGAKKDEGAAVPVALPSAWIQLTPAQAAAALAGADDAGEPIFYRASSGRELPLGSVESLAPAVAEGGIVVYKNPEQEQGDPTDSGPGEWFAGYHLTVPAQSPLAAPAAKADALIEGAARLDAVAKAKLSEFRALVHAARVQNMTMEEIAALKAEVRKARSGFSKAFNRLKKGVSGWRKAALKAAREDSVLAPTLLAAAAPKAADGLFTIAQAEQVLEAHHAAYDLPEVMSIDPAGGVRIDVDVQTAVGRLGSYRGYERNLKAFLRRSGVKGPIQIDRRDRLDDLQARVSKELISPALGAEALDELGRGEGGGKRWLEFFVPAGARSQAELLLPRIAEFLEPYALEPMEVRVAVKGWSEEDEPFVLKTSLKPAERPMGRSNIRGERLAEVAGRIDGRWQDGDIDMGGGAHIRVGRIAARPSQEQVEATAKDMYRALVQVYEDAGIAAPVAVEFEQAPARTRAGWVMAADGQSSAASGPARYYGRGVRAVLAELGPRADLDLATVQSLVAVKDYERQRRFSLFFFVNRKTGRYAAFFAKQGGSQGS